MQVKSSKGGGVGDERAIVPLGYGIRKGHGMDGNKRGKVFTDQ